MLEQDARDEACRLVQSAMGRSAGMPEFFERKAKELHHTAQLVERVIDDLDTARSLLQSGKMPEDFL